MPALSKLTYGTAQLGMAYGVANRTGRPNVSQVMNILAKAVEAGITCLDSSPVYGESERLVGLFLKENPGSFAVASKLPYLGKHKPLDGPTLKSMVEEAVRASLEMMGVPSLDYYLIHAETDYSLHGDHLFDALHDCREKGLIGQFGLSAYSPALALKAISEGAEVLQVPCNLFDQRWVDSGVLGKAEEADVTVFTRSTYLQGLIFLPKQELKQWFPEAAPFVSLLHRTSDKYDIPVAELAFCWVRDLMGVDSLVVGMETCEQLKENLSLLTKPELDDDVKLQLASHFSNVPVKIINPSLWPERL